jgi:hypothetical protein
MRKVGDRPGRSAVVLRCPFPGSPALMSPGSHARLGLFDELGECPASCRGAEDDVGGKVCCTGSEDGGCPFCFPLITVTASHGDTLSRDHRSSIIPLFLKVKHRLYATVSIIEAFAAVIISNITHR